MNNRTKFIIAIVAVLALAIGAVTFAVLTSTPEDEAPQNAAPVVKTDYVLTEEDKTEVQLVADSLLDAAGSYGWAPEILTNQTNLNLAKANSDTFATFNQLTHSTSDEAARQLNQLSDSSRYNNSVNTMIFSTPFSINTEFTSELVYPEEVYQLNGYNTIEVTAPIKTTLNYVVQDYNYRDDAGNLITGGVRYESMVFEGNISITVSQKPNGWTLENFNEDVHVFVTDKTFTFSNGQFDTTNANPVSYTVQQVNADGTLSEAVDNLPRFEELTAGTLDSSTNTEDGE